MSDESKDIQSYLARIRKTISDSKSIVSQAELRIKETDRLLEQQGLTREQVMAMHFSQAQIDAANDELKRRGLDPLEGWNEDNVQDMRYEEPEPLSSPDGGDDLVRRQRKFGMMMKPFQI